MCDTDIDIKPGDFYCVIGLTTFHRHLAALLVVRIVVEVHGTGEEEGQPEEGLLLV